MNDRLFIIAGPTASGKTQLSIELANRNQAEIISADSMQVYRKLDIGTAKPSIKERTLVKHHLIDVVEPDETFTVSDFFLKARATKNELDKINKPNIVCGGTGFYLNALINGLFPAPSSNTEIRGELEKRAESSVELSKMYEELTKVDAESAKRIHPNDKYRIVRALEVYLITGNTMTHYRELHNETKNPIKSLMIVLNPKKEILHSNIKTRTELMFKNGLVEEVKQILESGYLRQLKPLKSIGYLQTIAFLDGKISLDQAKEDIIKETTALAKRQLTWFKKQLNTVWLDPSVGIDRIEQKFKDFLRG